MRAGIKRTTGVLDDRVASSDRKHWSNKAACKGSPSLFELRDYDLPGVNYNEAKEYDKNRFETASKICSSCPVFTECYLDAKPEDFLVTMRAGILPTAFNPTPLGRPRKEAPSEWCKKGLHENPEWLKGGYGTRRCKECVTAGMQKRNDDRRNATTCQRGHQNFKTVMRNGREVRYCRTCKLEGDRERQRNKNLRRAAKLEA